MGCSIATFFQWKSKHPEQKLLWYICGSEYALAQEVKDAIIDQHNNLKLMRFDCDKQKWADIAAYFLSYHDDPWLVVLENAHALKPNQWKILTDWAWSIAKFEWQTTWLIVVTNESNPETTAEKFRPYVEKGRYVECKELSVEAIKKYCVSDYNCSDSAADLLIRLCSYNFRKVNNELEKLDCLGRHIDDNLISNLVVFSSDDVFVRCLLENNRDFAKRVVSAVDIKDTAKILNHLSWKLSFIYRAQLNDAKGQGAHQLASKVGCKPWQLLEYFGLKQHWGGQDILGKLQLICGMEELYSKHNQPVLELLTRFW